ncbi:ABC transporter ATP-binding protein [Denitrobaculum tricleocarpae]|uniref:ABC transporter ATP-binding protein n=1 Tax=Denitrobaculum tricleocarpae TaxID=2591009 RepID=A0A545T287_9PROT|nr:ABC transporter ATP-binding protein [Denitrobaculum tricleocarpae]TQV71313.1 ABC transporter ATP-binding protein [Denitrobaculum tricleocarpae]
MAAGIEVQGLSWHAGGKAIISEVSFSVPAGETLAVVGPNGAGKSTLLRCLYRYLKPSEGSVRIDGADIWSLGARDCARKLATVLQEQPADFGLTVRDIVALGRTPYRKGLAAIGARDRRMMQTAIERMELSELTERHLSSLSGGEKQRVMIARALAQEPDVILLDEPTNHLDIRHQLELLTLMRGLGPTVIASLHDLNLASVFADRVLLLAGGHVLGVGKPAEVLTAERILEAFRVQSFIDAEPVTGAPRFSFQLPNQT